MLTQLLYKINSNKYNIIKLVFVNTLIIDLVNILNKKTKF